MKFRRKERQERRELLASMKEMNDGANKHVDNGKYLVQFLLGEWNERCKHSGRSSCALRGVHRCLVEYFKALCEFHCATSLLSIFDAQSKIFTTTVHAMRKTGNFLCTLKQCTQYHSVCYSFTL